MTEETQWEPITRAWLMIKVGDVKKVKIAENIFALNERFRDFPKIHIVRADVVSGPYDIVVPVYTEYLSELEELKEIIKSLLPKDSEMDTALVIQHVPFQTWNTKGYVTYQELQDPPPESQLVDLSSEVTGTSQDKSSEPAGTAEGHKAWASGPTESEDSDPESSESPQQTAFGHKAWSAEFSAEADLEDKPSQGSQGHRAW